MEGYNISIIGKSGVGKSSLLNYLFGENLADVGAGKPQTEKGFHLKEGLILGKKVNIYDSWGLEAGKEEKWLNDFNRFQKEKQDEQNVRQWLHTVIYCISGEGKRIEDFEIEIIQRIKNESLKPVVVITKADSRGAEEFVSDVEKILGISPLLISNIEKYKGFGAFKRKSEPFGKDELIKLIKSSTAESLAERIEFILKSKISKGREFLQKKLVQTLEKELHKYSWLGYVSKNDLDQIQEILDSIVENENIKISSDISKIAFDAKKFYQDTIIDIIKVDLGKEFPYCFNAEDKMNTDSEPETVLDKIVTNLTIVAVLPVIFMPALIAAIVDEISPDFKNGIPRYSKTEILENFEKQISANLIEEGEFLEKSC